MNIEAFRIYCLSKRKVTEEFPFDEDTLVFKVLGKMFALTSLKKWDEGEQSINLKCDPERAIELRASYGCIQPGFHMSKKHWNTVAIDSGELEDEFIKELIDHSYNLVVAGMSKARKKLLAL